MKIFLLTLISLINLSAYAIEKTEPIKAAVGQTFALKQDVIFNEGITSVYSYDITKEVINRDNEKTESNLYCGFTREEDGSNCANYPKSIVKKGKYRVIRDANLYNSDTLIRLKVIEKKNSCTYKLEFYCIATGYYRFNETFKKLVSQEINYQASKLVDIQDDQTEPQPWP